VQVDRTRRGWIRPCTQRAEHFGTDSESAAGMRGGGEGGKIGLESVIAALIVVPAGGLGRQPAEEIPDRRLRGC